jgi:AcrR family transcriptional regulator
VAGSTPAGDTVSHITNVDSDNMLCYGQPVTEHPYHHGHLRAALLAEAERTLREQGIDALSLRDLARQAGVSHAAPRRHFADRQALLDALAEAGFGRLGDEVCAAIDQAGEDYQAGLRAVATAYVRFAIQDAALLQLMFTTKNGNEPGALPEASARLFAAVGDLVGRGQRAGVLAPGDPDRLLLLLVATLQGIASLVISERVAPGQADTIIADAVALFTGSGRLGRSRGSSDRRPRPSCR